MAKACKSQEEVAIEAINHASKALRKRHLLEEAAHAPAILALSRPIVIQVPFRNKIHVNFLGIIIIILFINHNENSIFFLFPLLRGYE